MKALIAVDLGEATPKILAKVRAICSPQAELWLIHVAEPEPSFVGWDAGPQSVRDAVAKRFHEEHILIQKFADELRSDGYMCTALLVQGSYADLILEESRKIGVDLIVMGTHGKGVAKQLIVGSVSESVLRKSTSPVLLVPTK